MTSWNIRNAACKWTIRGHRSHQSRFKCCHNIEGNTLYIWEIIARRPQYPPASPEYQSPVPSWVRTSRATRYLYMVCTNEQVVVNFFLNDVKFWIRVRCRVASPLGLFFKRCSKQLAKDECIPPTFLCLLGNCRQISIQTFLRNWMISTILLDTAANASMSK